MLHPEAAAAAEKYALDRLCGQCADYVAACAELQRALNETSSRIICWVHGTMLQQWKAATRGNFGRSCPLQHGCLGRRSQAQISNCDQGCLCTFKLDAARWNRAVQKGSPGSSCQCTGKQLRHAPPRCPHSATAQCILTSFLNTTVFALSPVKRRIQPFGYVARGTS